jgi:hypothetical protein
MRRSTAGKRKTRERDSAEGRSTRQRSSDIDELSLSFFFGELNTNASFAGSARCTENPLFLRSLVFKGSGLLKCYLRIYGRILLHKCVPFFLAVLNLIF